MANDIFDDPDVKAYLAHAEREMLPKMKDSAITIALFHDKIDIKQCVEIGAAILFDKPIVVVVCGSKPVPANLKRVASAIVEGNMRDDATKAKIQAALAKVLSQDRRTR